MQAHTVRPGETLSSIARLHATTWQVIAHLNAITRPNQLVIGQRLRLPPLHSRGARAAPAAYRPGFTPSPAAPPVASSQVNPHLPAVPAPADQGTPGPGVARAQLVAIMPNAGAKADTFVAPLNAAMRSYAIDTNEKRAAFLAQISVESGDLRHTEENLNYSAERLHQVWPKRFPTLASAQPYAHNPEALGNHVYANRLGNGDEASGDGYKFRGRGLMQTTGRSNYRAAGFEDKPDSLADPTTAADSAAHFWSSNGLNPRTASVLAHGPFNAISQTVNGGTNGREERWTAYGRAIDTFGLAAQK